MGEKKKTGEGGHQALYRKYRSKSLDEIKGQEHITQTLGNAIKQGKISHAYLFTGPRGTGKTSIARILAHQINGLPYEDEKAHLDIIEIDAASNRRIDDIRDLRDKVHIAPVSAKYKVYIIDEVHMLTSESFNALLKTLEEPPAHVIFILATTEVHKLPATIISRTQRHSFRLIPAEKVMQHLKYIAKQEDLKIDTAALTLLAEHGGGSFRDSISLLDQISSSSEAISSDLVELLLGLAPKETLKKLLVAAQSGDAEQVMNLIESLLEGGLTPSGIAGQLLSLLREDAKGGSADTATVGLMDKLLGVHSAQYPQLKLETVLLSLAPKERKIASKKKLTHETKEDTDTPESTPQPPTTPSEPTPPEPKDTPPAQTPKEKPVEKAAPESETVTIDGTIEDHWPKVLELTKQKNNSLYTVLRLATPEVDADGLLLIFSFPFHQKKIEEAKYKAAIAEIIKEALGASLDIRSIVDKSRAKPANSFAAEATPEPQPDPAHASHISNIQDIMGGGEVVHV